MWDKENSFSIGEFAKLFRISKQTLFYYERNHIFSPAFIDDNGYRYYTPKQYFIFEIIMALRTLGTPLKDIAAYVNSRSPDRFESLLLSRCDALTEEIRHLTENRDRLILHIERLRWISQLRTEIITVEYQGEQSVAYSPIGAASVSMKENVLALAEHKRPLSRRDVIHDRPTGYLVPLEELLSRDFRVTAFVTPCAEEEPSALRKSEGLYATMYKRDSYHKKYKEGLEKILAFAERNDMRINGDAYITPIRNYWVTDKQEDYITRISVAVEYNS